MNDFDTDLAPPAAPLRAARGCGGLFVGGFLTVWVTVWIGFLSLAGAAMLPDARLALRSAAFPQTAGRIERCDVKSRPDGEGGTTYRLDLEYAYEVNGRAYRGTRYDSTVVSNNDRGWHDGVADDLQPGTIVPVFYDPEAPATALLVPGITGGHLFVILFALPFLAVATLVVGGLGSAAVAAVKPRRGPIELGGLKRWDTGSLPPLVAAAGTAVTVTGAVGFASVFLVAITAGFRPPLWYPGGLLLAGVTLAGWAAAKTYRGRAGGEDDLVVDPMQRLVALPLGEGRPTRVAVPFEAIVGTEVARKQASGGKCRSFPAVQLRHEYAAQRGIDPIQRLAASSTGRSLPERHRRMLAWLEREIAAG